MSDSHTADLPRVSYWPQGWAAKVLSGLCGLLAILVALKAASFEPGSAVLFPEQENVMRVLAFAALTVWVTFAIGIKRAGEAAIITLAFTVFVEIFLIPIRFQSTTTVAAANLGIVLAYCSMRLYWLGLVETAWRRRNAGAS